MPRLKLPLGLLLITAWLLIILALALVFICGLSALLLGSENGIRNYLPRP